MLKNKFQKGFTLLEMVIVIIIVTIIAAFTIINYITSLERGRDAQRKSDLKQIRTGIELYRIDYGNYPTVIYQSGNCSSPSQLASDDGKAIYLEQVPCDPTGERYYNSGKYYYVPNDILKPTSYTITSCLENQKDSEGISTIGTPNREAGTPDCTSSRYYKLSNPP